MSDVKIAKTASDLAQGMTDLDHEARNEVHRLWEELEVARTNMLKWNLANPELKRLLEERREASEDREGALLQLKAAERAAHYWHSVDNTKSANDAEELVAGYEALLDSCIQAFKLVDQSLRKFYKCHPDYNVLAAAVQTAEESLGKAEDNLRKLDQARAEREQS